MTFSPDGKYVSFSASNARFFFVYDVNTGKVAARNKGAHTYSANGKYMVAPGAIIDVPSGQLVHSYELDRRMNEYYISDSHYMATVSCWGASLTLKRDDPRTIWDVSVFDYRTGAYRGCASRTFSLEMLPSRDPKLRPAPDVGANFKGPYAKLHQAGALAHGCFGIRFSPTGKPYIFPRLPKGALYAKIPLGKKENGVSLRDRVTDEQLAWFNWPAEYLPEPCGVSTDNGTMVAAGQTSEKKHELFAWDISAFRKYAARVRPDLPMSQWDGHWQKLAGEDPNAAFKSMRRLAASPTQTLAILKDRLRPVKTQIDLAALVAQLDGPFAARQKADQALRAVGDDAIPFLEKGLKAKQSLEARRRTEAILKDLRAPGLPPAETRRLLWSIELLEFLGNADAKKLLERLATGTPTAWVTLEARASLKRLAK
ncbi:MAG: hypothetical protein HYX68_08815 [Planctomycetes bacterium]|nr:hypothetical protein [Planctomycetota bacterium]